MLIRPVESSDMEPLIEMLQKSGQFDDDALLHVKQTLASYLAGESEALWLSAEHHGLAGVAYCSPEVMADSVWNLLMLWISPCHQRQGIGQALINLIEQELRARHTRLLIVETSSLAEFSAARDFYSKQGFIAEAKIRNFYTANEDKLIYTKNIKYSPAHATPRN